jgi:hypothetical protein
MKMVVRKDMSGTKNLADAYLSRNKLGNPDDTFAEEVELEFTSTCRSMVHSFYNKEWQKSRYNASLLRDMLDNFESSLDIIETRYNKEGELNEVESKSQ